MGDDSRTPMGRLGTVNERLCWLCRWPASQTVAASALDRPDRYHMGFRPDGTLGLVCSDCGKPR